MRRIRNRSSGYIGPGETGLQTGIYRNLPVFRDNDFFPAENRDDNDMVLHF